MSQLILPVPFGDPVTYLPLTIQKDHNFHCYDKSLCIKISGWQFSLKILLKWLSKIVQIEDALILTQTHTQNKYEAISFVRPKDENTIFPDMSFNTNSLKASSYILLSMKTNDDIRILTDICLSWDKIFQAVSNQLETQNLKYHEHEYLCHYICSNIFKKNIDQKVVSQIKEITEKHCLEQEINFIKKYKMDKSIPLFGEVWSCEPDIETVYNDENELIKYTDSKVLSFQET